MDEVIGIRGRRACRNRRNTTIRLENNKLHVENERIKDENSQLKDEMKRLKVQLKLMPRTKLEWEQIAMESLIVEQVGSDLCAYGSELAVLRLFYSFNRITNYGLTRCGYNESMKSHYFILEVKE